MGREFKIVRSIALAKYRSFPERARDTDGRDGVEPCGVSALGSENGGGSALGSELGGASATPGAEGPGRGLTGVAGHMR